MLFTCIVNFLQKVKKVLAVWNKFLFLHQLNSILLTVKIHKSWQLRKKLQKKLQRKPLLRRRKLQRRRNNFSFLEAKNIKVPNYFGTFFLYLHEVIYTLLFSAETRYQPALQQHIKKNNVPHYWWSFLISPLILFRISYYNNTCLILNNHVGVWQLIIFTPTFMVVLSYLSRPI
jgi:hypothetical protein